MPEIAVDEDAERVLPQYEIRSARKGSDMSFEFQAQRLKHDLDRPFWASIAAPDAAHDRAAGFRAHEISTVLARR